MSKRTVVKLCLPPFTLTVKQDGDAEGTDDITDAVQRVVREAGAFLFGQQNKK